MKPSLAVHAFLWGRVALLSGLMIVTTTGLSSARAAEKGGIATQVAALQEDVQMLQQQVSRLIDQARTQNATVTQIAGVVNSQSRLIAQLQQQNQALQATLACMSKTGDDVYFTGCNVHIVSGSGATGGAVNGLGNLIVGYNEDGADLGAESPSERGGSHNLVVGPGHSYRNYGGLVAGMLNSVAGLYSSVTGGAYNSAEGPNSSISGGIRNTTYCCSSSISGGENNSAGMIASVSGGRNNRAISPWSSISGGEGNSTIDGWAASVSGGSNNTAFGDSSSVSGGSNNRAAGYVSSVSGGRNNIAGVEVASELSGSSVSGGSNNRAYGVNSSISGGEGNVVGSFSPISGRSASISGGQNRAVLGDYDWAAGEFFSEQ